MGAFGGLFHGPTGHLFYGLLERQFPGASTSAVVKKVSVLGVFYSTSIMKFILYSEKRSFPFLFFHFIYFNFFFFLFLFILLFFQVTVDQLVWCPLFTVALFTITGITAGFSPREIFAIFKISGPQAILSSWLIWPAAHAINFRVIPGRQRLLYINIIQLFFNAILSALANSAV